MEKNFLEIVFEGHENTVRGYLEGFRDGTEKPFTFFFSSESGIETETLSETIREWVSLRQKLHHVIVEEELFRKVEKALSRKGRDDLLTSSSIKSLKNIKEAKFDFTFDVYARKYADEIKALFDKLPEGISLHYYKPEERINHDAEGVELYTPAHDYIFQGKGTISGEVEKVMVFRKIIDEHPLIEAKKIILDF